jgi:large subunit ribosomal protein L4
MPTLDLVNQENKKVGSIDLAADVFGVKVNFPLVHQVIKAQLADRRQGTAKNKTKGEVRGGGKKPFKQKGTGNARQGSNRSSIHVGGGSNFGPQPRSYAQATPKEMMRGALRSALSDRLASNRLIVVDEFKFKDHKTKAFNGMMKDSFKLDKVLIVDEENKNLELSGRNVPKVRVLRTEGINVYDIVRHEWLILTKKSLESVQKRLSEKA